jgi:hypothetical protein
MKLSPEVATLTRELARATAVESAQIGEGGDASKVFPLFAKLKAAASPSELRALTRHESPVVRAYVGEELAKQNKAAPELQALLRDQTVVTTVAGCERQKQTIASFVGEAIAGSPSK